MCDKYFVDQNSSVAFGGCRQKENHRIFAGFHSMFGQFKQRGKVCNLRREHLTEIGEWSW